MCVWRVLSNNQAGKLLLGFEPPRETRKLKSLNPFPAWVLLPPDCSSSHHSSSDHEENQYNNDAYVGNGGLRKFCGGKRRGPDLRFKSWPCWRGPERLQFYLRRSSTPASSSPHLRGPEAPCAAHGMYISALLQKGPLGLPISGRFHSLKAWSPQAPCSGSGPPCHAARSVRSPQGRSPGPSTSGGPHGQRWGDGSYMSLEGLWRMNQKIPI